MNEIFVYVKAESGKKIFVGSFDDISTIERDVWFAMNDKKITQYKNKVYMLIGTETFQLKMNHYRDLQRNTALSAKIDF